MQTLQSKNSPASPSQCHPTHNHPTRTPQRTPWLDGRHQVFGRVTSGMDLLERISHTPVDKEYRPKTPITIKAVGTLGSPPVGFQSASAPRSGASPTVHNADPGAAASAPDGAAAYVADEAGLQLSQSAVGPDVTKVIFFDLEQNGVDLGRVVFGL
jgi:hypothetical protein